MVLSWSIWIIIPHANVSLSVSRHLAQGAGNTAGRKRFAYDVTGIQMSPRGICHTNDQIKKKRKQHSMQVLEALMEDCQPLCLKSVIVYSHACEIAPFLYMD